MTISTDVGVYHPYHTTFSNHVQRMQSKFSNHFRSFRDLRRCLHPYQYGSASFYRSSKPEDVCGYTLSKSNFTHSHSKLHEVALKTDIHKLRLMPSWIRRATPPSSLVHCQGVSSGVMGAEMREYQPR